MKPLIFVLFLFILGTASGASTTTTYMGKKAGSGPFNPCKGATTRPCAVVQQSFDPVTTSSNGNVIPGTEVTETITIFEEDGTIFSVTNRTYIVNKPIKQTIEEFIEEHEKNGGQVESD